MKRKIRKQVFETNSSSQHSIVILKESMLNKDYYFEQYIEKNGILDIWDDDSLMFGRSPFKFLMTFDDKVRYSIASLCGCGKNKEETLKSIEDIVREVHSECRGIKLPKIRWTGEEETYYGYVDENILADFLEEHKISLKEFLLNKRYVVVVDGDEYRIFEDMKESGIIDMNNIEKEYPED